MLGELNKPALRHFRTGFPISPVVSTKARAFDSAGRSDSSASLKTILSLRYNHLHQHIDQ